MQRRITLERLHAEERGRANQLLLQKFESQTKSESEEENMSASDMTTSNEKPLFKPESSKSEDSSEPNKEAKIEAFLDEIEGETLGQMLHYLSSELEPESSNPENNEESQSSEIIAKRQQKQSEQIGNVQFFIYFKNSTLGGEFYLGTKT